jgi:hypothetical protein
MEVHAPKTKDKAVNKPLAKSHPVPQETNTKITIAKHATNQAQMVYSALKKLSAPS